MIKLLIFNIRMRLIERLAKSEYDYVDYLIDRIGCLSQFSKL